MRKEIARRLEFVTFHSMLNKSIGFVLFILPFTIRIIDIKYSAIVVCLLATFVATQEGYFIIEKCNINNNRKLWKQKN